MRSNTIIMSRTLRSEPQPAAAISIARVAGTSVFFDEGFDREGAKIGKSLPKPVVRPIPPRNLDQLFGERRRQSLLDQFRRNTSDDHIGRDGFADDGTRGHDGAGADRDSGEDDRAMAEPDVVADRDVVVAAPVEEAGVVRRAEVILGRAVSEMMLRCSPHRVIAGIDAGCRRDRTEFADVRIDGVGVSSDIAIVTDRHFGQPDMFADIDIAP